MENQNPRVPIQWEHSLTNLLGHDYTSDPGIALRQWVHFQGVHNILDLLSWDQEDNGLFHWVALILLFMLCHFQGSEPNLGRDTLIEPKGLLDIYCSYLMVQSGSELGSLTSHL